MRVGVAAWLAAMACCGLAQEDDGGQPQRIVVSATRLDTSVEQVGSDVTVVTRADIERSQKTTVIELLRSGGFSAARRRGGNREDDAYENRSVSARLRMSPTETLDLDFVFRYVDSESELDNFGGPGGDDPNYRSDGEQLYFRAQARLSLLDDLWEQKLGLSFSDQHRRSRNDTDHAHPLDLEPEKSKGCDVGIEQTLCKGAVTASYTYAWWRGWCSDEARSTTWRCSCGGDRRADLGVAIRVKGSLRARHPGGKGRVLHATHRI